MTIDSFLEGSFHASTAELSFVEGPAHGRSVVLIHGVGSRWQPFQPILPALSDRFHVYALDLRGHGGSSHVPGAYRLDDYTGDVHEFITQEVGEAAAIYGHSLGALVGINLAAQEPEEVACLILGDPPLYHHDTLTKDTFWQAAFTELLDFMLAHANPTEMESWLAQNMPNMTPERREERVQSLSTLDPDVVRAIISDAQMKGVSLTQLAWRVACPILLLRGDQELGSALRQQDVNFAVKNFRNIRVLEMKTIGHSLVPASLLPELMEFIDAAMGGESAQ
jgi:pimeloyl-ACP methyl ester carboxylesterase